MERTLVIIKPDAIKNRHIGDIISIYESNGLTIKKIKMMYANESLLKEHYHEHIDKSFYPALIKFILSGKIVIMEIEGENAVAKVRKINGATDPIKAKKGTIRNLYGSTIQQNAVHGSANIIDANRELKIWFN